MAPVAECVNAYIPQRPFVLDSTMRETRFVKLSAFVAIADCGSFTKASAQLGITTGSLSHTMRELEESLGVRLLNRTTRSVAPTEAGQRLLTRLRPLFDGVDRSRPCVA